ncbi:MAG: helix-turn-helix domain-containing protein [Thermodesulfobacteriota bacterium]
MGKKAISLENLAELARRLKKVRKAAGETQAAVGAAVGLSQAYIQHYESGKVEPPIAYLVWFSNRFNVSLDWLLTGREATGHIGPSGTASIALPPWDQRPLEDEERTLLQETLDVLRSPGLPGEWDESLKRNIRSFRSGVAIEADRPRCHEPPSHKSGGQNLASGGGQQGGKRRSTGAR